MAASEEAFHGGEENRSSPRTRASVSCKNEARFECRDMILVDDPANLVSNASSSISSSRHSTVPGDGFENSNSNRNSRKIHHVHALSSLPMLCRDHTRNLVSKFGFVVTRRSRTLSLDDQSIFPSPISSISSSISKSSLEMSKMGKFASRDDSYIPLLPTSDIRKIKNDLLSSSDAASAKLSKVRRDLSDRSQSFDCREFDLVKSSSKFLLLEYHKESEDEDSGASSSSPFKPPASIPFKWEIAPGLPKPEAAKPDPTLQLPPRLLVRSLSTKPGMNSPNHQQKRRASSVNNRHSLLGIRSPSSSSSSEVGKIDPSSPTSVFCGPSSSQSSSSESCDSDSRAIVLVSDAESGLSTQHPQILDDDSNLGPPKSSLGDSIVRIFNRGKAKFTRKYRRKKDVEMWAPTLAAYFTSQSASSPKLDLRVEEEQKSGDQSEDLSEFKSEDLSEFKSENLSEVPGEESVESNEFHVTNDITHCGCASPRFTPFSPQLKMSLKRLGSGNQKKWVSTRIHKTSKVLQTFVAKAVHARPRA